MFSSGDLEFSGDIICNYVIAVTLVNVQEKCEIGTPFSEMVVLFLRFMLNIFQRNKSINY